MVVVFVLAGLAVLGAVVALAMGRGGELIETHPDYAPLPAGADGRTLTARDAARLRLPRTFWGYQPQLTDEALHRLAGALSEQEARVAVLEQQLRDLRGGKENPGGTVGAPHGLDETAPNGAAPPLRKEVGLRKEATAAGRSVDDGYDDEGHEDAPSARDDDADDFTPASFAGDAFKEDGLAEDEWVGGPKEDRR